MDWSYYEGRAITPVIDLFKVNNCVYAIASLGLAIHIYRYLVLF